MLIVAIGYGVLTDPFTCSAAWDGVGDMSKVECALEMIHRSQFSDTSLETVRLWVDQILVIDHDEVAYSFCWEDGLGEQLPEAIGFVGDEDVSEFADFAEAADDGDDDV